MSIRLILLLCLAALLLFPDEKLFAQEAAYHEYTFNSEGSACYLKYVCYAPNNDYSLTKRPYIFVLGRPGETALQTFQKDTVRDLPEFYNYKFVYVPNRGATSAGKLLCLEALVSLQTYHYECGRSNVFLSVYDTTITATDISVTHVDKVFHAVRIGDPDARLPSESVTQITFDFKEDQSAYYSESVREEDELGTFYYEEAASADSSSSPGNRAAVKTYFGAPEAYSYTLSGIVKDRSTGEALPFAGVQVKGTTTGVYTNADGYFTLPKVPCDTSVLIVTYVGYTRTEVFLSPSLPKRNFVIEISPSVNSTLKTVTIVGAREDVVLARKEDVSVVKMTPRQIEKLPSIGEKDVMRSFQLMPGVSASQESSSGLYVRGGTPDQNLVLFDGFTVYHVDHLYGYFSAFNSNVVKDVQLYKGGFESRFGGRLSSVTEITGKDGNQKKLNMGGDLSLLSANAWLEIPVGEKFTSVIGFRRSYQGPIYKALFEKYSRSTSSSQITQQGPGGRSFTQNAKVTNYFYDLNGKFTYRPTSRDIISLSIFNGTDKLDNSIENSGMPSFGGNNSSVSMSSTDLTKYGNIGSSIKWSRKWTDSFYGNTLLSYSNFYSNRDRSVVRTGTGSNGEETTSRNGLLETNDLRDYSFKSDYQWDPFKYSYAQNDTNTILERNNKAFIAGGFVQNKFRLFRNLVIFLPGVRASYFETTREVYYEPRASLTINITDKLTLKGATGKYYQFANRVTREDILSGSKDFWLLSDGSSVPVSSAMHYIAGVSYENSSYLFSVEGYYKTISNVTEYSLRYNPSPMGVSYDENFFTGHGYAKGIEFLVQKKGGKLNGWVSYTLGEAQNHFDVYSDSYFAANQDVTHEFKIVGLYNLKRWDFCATWIFATGRPYTAPSGAYSVALLDGNTQDFFTVTAKNGMRLPDYHRADISANYKLLAGGKGDKKRKEIGYIGFSVFNVYNRTNVWYKTYSIEDGAVLETNVNYSGITPNVTLSLKLR
jgi:hypothetical protein